jgi:drug/metabolite transporter (DMT)-like permease
MGTAVGSHARPAHNIRGVSTPVFGELAGLGGAAVWAAVSTAMRAASERTSAVTINWLRCSFATLTLAILVVLLGRIPSLEAIHPGALAAIVISGVLGQAMGDGLLLQGMKMIGASRALPISNTSPLLTIAMAMVLLGERITWIEITGSILVLGAVYLLAFPRGMPGAAAPGLRAADKRGVLLALSAALCYASSTVILKEGLADVDLLVANLLRMGTASAFLFGLETISFGWKLPRQLGRRAFAIVALAGVANSLSSLLYLTAVSYAGAAKASVLASTTPLFALPISLFLLHERINSRIVAGTIVAILGIWMVILG